jgi:hypothetical protein
MKKLFLALLAMATALAIAPAALAGTISIGSWAANGSTGAAAGNTGGFANTQVLYSGVLGLTTSPIGGTPVAPSIVPPSTGVAAYNVSPWSGGTSGSGTQIWVGPIGTSSYVSNHATSGPDDASTNPAHADENGYYYYTSTFAATAGTYYGSISVLADDTMALYIDGILIVNFGNVGSDGHCAANVPNCATVDTVSISGINLSASNTIEVIDAQTDVNAAGIDFDGTLTPTPEPSSLLLLGTGLLGLAFVAFRKAKSSGVVLSM